MIDTQDKRRSVQAYTEGLVRPVPDGAIGAADRATCTWFYSGISYNPTPPAQTGGISIPTGLSPEEGISHDYGLSIGTGISRFLSLLTRTFTYA